MIRILAVKDIETRKIHFLGVLGSAKLDSISDYNWFQADMYCKHGEEVDEGRVAWAKDVLKNGL